MRNEKTNKKNNGCCCCGGSCNILYIPRRVGACRPWCRRNAIAASAESSGNCGDSGSNVTWSLDDNGTLTISGSGKIEDYRSDIDQPWYSNRSDITSVVIEPGVTSIGSLAFYKCSNLTSITIPSGLTSIGEMAFLIVPLLQA